MLRKSLRTVRYGQLKRVSTLTAEQPQAPYVHIGDRVLTKGKSCITKPSPNSVHVEAGSQRKPSYRNVSSNYIFDRAFAKKMASLILPHHVNSKLFVEINPGIGCLTAELLNNGINNLHLIEANQTFHDYLQTYRSLSDNVTISNQRFSYFGDAVSMSSLWVNVLSKQSWDMAPQASVYSVIPPRQERFLIPWLVNMIANWHEFGRFRYFFVVSDRLLWRCTNSEIASSGNFKHYTVGHILATTLFDIRLLAKLNKSDFVPPIAMSHVELNSKSKKAKSPQYDYSKMALTVIEPRRDLQDVMTLSNCILFAGFCRQLTARRHARVIPTCERLLPGIGLPLLDVPEITSPSTRIGDLKPRTFLQIFQMMKKSPHFVPELFLPSHNQQHLSNPSSHEIGHELDLSPLHEISPVSTRKKNAMKTNNQVTAVQQIGVAETSRHGMKSVVDNNDEFALLENDCGEHLQHSDDFEDDIAVLHGHSSSAMF